MNSQLVGWLQDIEDRKLGGLVSQLHERLLKPMADVPTFTESRARALLRTTNVVDDPTLADFKQLISHPAGIRTTLYQLLNQAKLSPQPIVPNSEPTTTSWLVTILAAFANQREYPLHQLDPAQPPAPNSPAGQLVQRAGQFIRQQSQQSVTDRDRLAKKLAFAGIPTTTDVDNVSQTPVIPAPEIFRPPIPVNYPEMNPTIALSDNEVTETSSSQGRLRITEADLAPSPPPPAPQPPVIRIDAPPVRVPPRRNAGTQTKITTQVRQQAQKLRQTLHTPAPQTTTKAPCTC